MPKSSDKDDPFSRRILKNKFTSKFKSFLEKIFSRRPPKNSNDNNDNTNPQSVIIENEIINNLNILTEKTIEDVMIPRSDMVSVSIDANLEEISKIVIKYGHTRTLVYKGQTDNIVGFIHIKDLFEVIAKSKKTTLKSLVRKHIVSPYSMKLIDLLTQMQKNRTHIAVILDEYGATDGLITIEDIIEEIVGRIDDEHDIENDAEYKIIKPGLMIANARMYIEDLEKILSVKLKTEDDEFDTIAGLIMVKSGHVPEKGEIININDNIIVEVLDATPRTIKQVQIRFGTINQPKQKS